jgi:chromosome segregation ATPase
MLPKQGADNDEAIKDIKMELEAQKMRCDGHERMIKDLQSICDTHENTLEMLRQQIVELHRSNGTLNATYYGETYDIVA